MVGDAFNIALGFILLIIGTWVLIFGGIGLMLARSLGQNPVLGFALGTILGPLGWLITWLMGKRNGITRAAAGFAGNVGDAIDLPDPGAGGDDPWADLPFDDPLDSSEERSGSGF